MTPTVFTIAVLITATCRLSAEPRVFPGLPTYKELAKEAGYSSESQLITTEDGYELWLLRIGQNNGPPALLVHGIFVSSDVWLIRGKNIELAYLLLSKGYDVYLGTVRGTAHSEGHTVFSRTDPRYWNYTFHEEALYDISANIDAVLTRTNRTQLIYVGHSLGCTTLMMLLSWRPEYNSKIKAAFLISPVIFTSRPFEMASPILRTGIMYTDLIYGLLSYTRNFEIWPRTENTIKAIRYLCGSPPTQGFCLDLIGLVFGEHRGNMDQKNLGYIFSFAPAGTSLNALSHGAQFFRTGEFQPLSYGCEENKRRYGSCKPPSYKLDRVTAPVYIYWGSNDYLISEWAVKRFVSSLGNVRQEIRIPDPRHSHIDPLVGLDVKEMLFDRILASLMDLGDS